MWWFLLLNAGVFDVLAYTDKDFAVPFTWIESDAKLIANPQMVKLHSFDTKVGSAGQNQSEYSLDLLKVSQI